jgi:hypothetical protein
MRKAHFPDEVGEANRGSAGILENETARERHSELIVLREKSGSRVVRIERQQRSELLRGAGPREELEAQMEMVSW